MVNYKTVSAVLAVLTIVFIASTGFLAATSSSAMRTVVQTQTQIVTSTVTVTQTPSQTSSQTTSSSSQGKLAISLAYSPSLGSYLTNGTGWTLYLFTKDTVNSGASSCYGQCATFWPPLYGSASSLSLPPGVSASAFGTITRTDGTKQITYQGWPLYYYAGDKAVGQTNGQNKFNTWFVVNIPTIQIPANVTITTATTST